MRMGEAREANDGYVTVGKVSTKGIQSKNRYYSNPGKLPVDDSLDISLLVCEDVSEMEVAVE